MVLRSHDTLFTDRQKEVLRYRKGGMTQQQIAEIIHTSKANVCTIEKCATDNIRRAKETLNFIHTLEARHLCTLKAGEDLFDTVPSIFKEAGNLNMPLTSDSINLINRLRTELPKRIHGRLIREDIEVYLGNDGNLEFG